MPSSRPSLAARLRAGETIVTAWCGLPAPSVVEALARAGYPSVTLDMQHGQHDLASTRDGMSAAVLGGAHPVARPQVDDFGMVSRLLDLGAEMIIMPMVNSVEDALALVGAAKYPPVGARSWGPHRGATLLGHQPPEYLRIANTETLALAMIETPAAIEALPDILSVDGLDGVFVGPSDLSLTLSGGAGLDPSGAETQGAAARIASATVAAGKIAGIFCNSVEDAKAAQAMGFRFMSLGTDLGLLTGAAQGMLKAFC